MAVIQMITLALFGFNLWKIIWDGQTIDLFLDEIPTLNSAGQGSKIQAGI